MRSLDRVSFCLRRSVWCCYRSIARSLSSSSRNLALDGESGMKALQVVSCKKCPVMGVYSQNDKGEDDCDQAEEYKDDLVIRSELLLEAGNDPYLIWCKY